MASDKKSEVGELRSLLRSIEIQRDPAQYQQVVQKVIAYMTLGVDVSPLFSEMIMAGATQNIVQKKMVYLYLSTYAERNSELALLTINTLRKDASDRNPTIRGLALRSMSSLRLPNVIEYIESPLQSGLTDKSPYVRRTAVMGVVKLYYIAPDIVSDMKWSSVLYDMLRDDDPLVVCNCLSALEEILANDGGIVISKKLAHYLINRIRDFSEWGQCQVLQLLLKYNCTDDEEALEILNALDDRLKHVMVGVVMATIRLFFHLTESMPEVYHDVFERVKTPLLTLLGSGPSEVIYVVLQHIEIILSQNSTLFSSDYHNFYYRFNDPPYVKLKKLDLLTQVSDDSNSKDIIQELSECATDVNVGVSQKSIHAIGLISVKLPDIANYCVDRLLALIPMEIEHVTSEVITTMSNILRKYENTHELILPRLNSCYATMTSGSGRGSLIWILGEYGESLDESPYILEDIINNISGESSLEVKLQLLSATMKMFFKRPPECQEMLGRLLEYCIEEETDMLLRDRALLYYRLLKKDVAAAKKIVCGSQKVYSHLSTHSKGSLFSEFNTLSVVYGQSSAEFIHQSIPYTSSAVLRSPERRMNEMDQLLISKEEPEESLLDILASKESVSTVPHILLNPTPVITASEYEQYWKSLPLVSQDNYPMRYIPSLKTLQDLLSKRFITTLACSGDLADVKKMYLYGQHVSTLDRFLLEVVMAANKMEVLLKCTNDKLYKQFLLHYLETISDYM
ncbi:PREDICTED: AP-4 complex subunit beta-1-like [Amphimedon queenslandica]|uniref:Beta-adaptin appendage C-terminal subdomain domain-containing protein n=1 Tax=Amphimedon queenslandica TaxID=400682 RepID=A0A1X7VRR1_AMPQE|nr:PREDICTED: AP-4 complex subunit beta-1-like [Amphimedon queenslandica]|eukprot:XP_003383030.1 PREDICTED: AP-4 complex subunit beta-1-like [Amphimedon queenslandica]